MQVIHEVTARRLNVNEARDSGADAVNIVDGQVDAEATGDCEQVHDGVGGSADRGKGHDRVVERGLGEKGGEGALLADEFDRKPAGGM